MRKRRRVNSKRGQKRKKHKFESRKGGPPYVRKEMRTTLGNLSMLAFGSRSKWQKFCINLGLDIASVKEQMEAIIQYAKLQYEEINNARKKVRSEQAQNVSNTAESSDGSGQSNDSWHGQVRAPSVEIGDGLVETVERVDEASGSVAGRD